MQLKVSEIPLTLEKARFIETCAKWRNYPPRPAIYILAAKKPFNWGSEETDILYIGETKHFGFTPNNNRLWDYHTKATEHEQEIIEKVKEMENAGKTVYIFWCFDWPKNYTPKEYEKHLLRWYKDQHGKLPMFNRKV